MDDSPSLYTFRSFFIKNFIFYYCFGLEKSNWSREFYYARILLFSNCRSLFIGQTTLIKISFWMMKKNWIWSWLLGVVSHGSLLGCGIPSPPSLSPFLLSTWGGNYFSLLLFLPISSYSSPLLSLLLLLLCSTFTVLCNSLNNPLLTYCQVPITVPFLPSIMTLFQDLIRPDTVLISSLFGPRSGLVMPSN